MLSHLPNPPLQRTGRRWRGSFRRATAGGRPLNGSLVSLAASFSRTSLISMCAGLVVACASSSTHSASELHITVAGALVPLAELQSALAAGLSREPEPYVVLRTSWAVTPAALQQLLECAWVAGTSEVLLQERAAIGNTDAAFKIEPSMRHGYDWSGETRSRYLANLNNRPSPPYVSILRPVSSSPGGP